MIAGLMLASILPGALVATGWLSTTLALMVLYVVLGTLAMKCARTPRACRGFYSAALLIYFHMLGVMRMHHPLDSLHGWLA